MQIDDSVIRSLKKSGAPQEVIDAAKKKSKPNEEVFEVWEDNWESFLFFLDVSNQWFVESGFNEREYLGLNYPSIESIIRTFQPVKKNKRQGLYRDLRTIELAALPILNKRKG